VDEFKIIAKYIAESYPAAVKIIEVGVGKMADVALELSQLLPSCQVIVTDVVEPPALPERVKFLRDDITKPDVRLYEGAALVYAMRPPPELQPYLLKVAREVGADLLIKPLAGESAPLKGGELINYQRATFYLFKSGKGQGF
jgi:hypothetical protein